MAEQRAENISQTPLTLIIISWIGTVLTSFFTNIVLKEFFAVEIPIGFRIRIGIAIALFLLSFLWQASRPLQRYWMIILTLLVAEGVIVPFIQNNRIWNTWFNTGTSFFITGLGTQILRLLSFTIAPWLVMFLMGMKRGDYFLCKGQLNAPSQPVKWLGEKKSLPWNQYGFVFGIICFIVTLVILIPNFYQSLSKLPYLLPLLPAILLFAALNAFNENFAARAALLPHILPAIGKHHSLLLTAFYFGVWHFYGTPPGIIGILFPAFLGWILAKAMAETKGFLMSWMIQFPLDILIFISFALNIK